MNHQYLYNAKYYDSLYQGGNTFPNNEIMECRFEPVEDSSTDNSREMILGYRELYLKTIYPGMLIGIGNPHAGAKSDDEIKLGFTFDYTTGKPYIPGSTVKGTIRSAFPDIPRANVKDTVRSQVHKDYIKSIMEKNSIKAPETDDQWIMLMQEIFGNQKQRGRDVFFDAYPVKGTSEGKVFSFESITPHKTFKNPVPIKLLKILPDVVFRFEFAVKQSRAIPEISADNKITIFKQILLDFGTGAKTNVGFGTLEEAEKPDKDYGFVVGTGTYTSVDTATQMDEHVITAKVCGYNDNKTTAKLLSKDNRKASLYFRNVPGAKAGEIDRILPVNTNVSIRYDGKNDKGYDQWRLIRIIE